MNGKKLSPGCKQSLGHGDFLEFGRRINIENVVHKLIRTEITANDNESVMLLSSDDENERTGPSVSKLTNAKSHTTAQNQFATEITDWKLEWLQEGMERLPKYTNKTAEISILHEVDDFSSLEFLRRSV